MKQNIANDDQSNKTQPEVMEETKHNQGLLKQQNIARGYAAKNYESSKTYSDSVGSKT